MTARDVMLARIRSALHDVPPDEDSPVTRAYRRESASPQDKILDLFVERVRHYRATVRRIEEADIPAAVAEALAARGARRVALPDDLSASWLPNVPHIAWIRDHGLTAADLDEVDGVLTGCASAIAETGTVVLDGGPESGRRILTLMPDYHLCVVRASQVVELVPEGMAAVRAAPRSGLPVTFISGPSATSDIELRRVEGVHGPRTLEILLVS